MNNKLLITVYVPILEQRYDLFIPSNKQVNEAVILIEKALKNLSGGVYCKQDSHIYKRDDFAELDYSKSIKENGLQNGSELVLL